MRTVIARLLAYLSPVPPLMLQQKREAWAGDPVRYRRTQDGVQRRQWKVVQRQRRTA